MIDGADLHDLRRLVVDAARGDLARGRLVTGPRGVAPNVAEYAHDRTLTVVVVATQAQAHATRDAVASWMGFDDEVALWEAWDVAPYERVSPDVAVMGRRLHVRHALRTGRLRVVVATASSLVQVVPDEVVARALRVGDTVDRDELARWLVLAGYNRQHLVEHRGEVAVRGDIVDVWPSHLEEPVRLELFGDTVERVGSFDVTTQRSLHSLEELTLHPAREWIPSESERAVARDHLLAHASTHDVLGPLSEGSLIDGMESWLPWCSTSRRTLLDVVADTASIVVVNPTAVARRAEEIVAEERVLSDVLGETWGLDEPTPLLHAGYDEVVAGRAIDLVVDTEDTEGRVDVTDPPVVQGQLSRLAQHVRANEGRVAVVVASDDATRERLTGLLADEGLSVGNNVHERESYDVTVITSAIPDGLAAAEVVVWSESDITGRRTVHRRARARTRHTDGFFDDLQVGSYVVHRNLGVARYAGSTTRTLGETTRDYVILEFRGDDRLYLPTDQIDLLTPYSGGESPQLSRMGGNEWQRTRAKAKSAAQEVADDLVALYRLRAGSPGHAFGPDTQWQIDMESLFPFEETPDQRQAILDVKADMESPRPMDRLVCADVGFGKTEIAIRALFKAVQDGKQAALLVPTTLLASQHFATVSERFASFPVKVNLLSRFVSDEEASATLRGLEDGSVDVVVGTHRLLGDRVRFKDLGLLVVDEEQRFGVMHKDAIKRMSVGVDVLTLSASPIPRTLEMALTGIRDLSMVTTPPTDRRPILTHVGEYDEAAVIEAIRRELLREGQVFFVHNRVSDIELVAKRLGELVPEARITVAHGQMDEGSLERVVQDFWERRFDVLVCTTIVESGIDMPTVNTLIVDRADRLGLGQMHQLRGRVGRAGARAYAYLFHPKHQILSEKAFERLRTIGDNTALGSGFKIAMRDLEIRGAGHFLGERQSGHVAAVGYDLYVQLVAEAVSVAKGERPPVAAVVSLPRVGVAHLPEEYVASDDQRLEAYRRLAAATTDEEVADVGVEWRDRFGPLPLAAEGLLRVTRLRVACLRTGIRDVVVNDQGSGSVVRLSPVIGAEADVRRWRERFGSYAYDADARELRVGLDEAVRDPGVLVELVNSLFLVEAH